MKKSFKDYDTAVPHGIHVRMYQKGRNPVISILQMTKQFPSILRKFQLQDDVVDLNNKVATQYNEMIAGDTVLADFLTKFTNDLNEAVGKTCI